MAGTNTGGGKVRLVGGSRRVKKPRFSMLLLKRMVTLLTLLRNGFQRDRRNALPSKHIYNEFFFKDLLHGISIGKFVYSFRRPMRGTGVLIGKFV
jgi:hypothetical protein